MFVSTTRLATFVPEMKGKPGKIALWSYPVADAPIASRSSFRAQVGALPECIFYG
ncbi:unnamed protein product [Scytosiphon promiscuus]